MKKHKQDVVIQFVSRQKCFHFHYTYFNQKVPVKHSRQQLLFCQAPFD